MKFTRIFDIKNAVEFQRSGTNNFAHEVNLVKKKPKKSLNPASTRNITPWFMKKISKSNNEIPIFSEILSQELFRMLFPGTPDLPRHPKTRLVVSNKDNILGSRDKYIASKKVEITSLTEVSKNELKTGLESGAITGLGEVQVLAMFLGEIDLKGNNLGLNPNKQIVKIDGELCFSIFNTYEEGSYVPTISISSAGLAKLPYIDTEEYNAYNWLDQKEGGHGVDKAFVQPQKDAELNAKGFAAIEQAAGKPIEKAQAAKLKMQFEQEAKYWADKRQAAIEAPLLLSSLTDSPTYRLEVNRTLLKIIMLPPALLVNFTKTYIPADRPDLIDRFSDFLIKRTKMIYNAAVNNESFTNYMQTADAIEQIAELTKNINTFIPYGKMPLVNSVENYENWIQQTFDVVLTRSKANLPRPVAHSLLTYTTQQHNPYIISSTTPAVSSTRFLTLSSQYDNGQYPDIQAHVPQTSFANASFGIFCESNKENITGKKRKAEFEDINPTPSKQPCVLQPNYLAPDLAQFFRF
jgi:hypothetical protein